MKLIPFDVKTEFERHCGADVKFVACETKNLQLYVEYRIPSVDDTVRKITARLANGTNTARRDTARRIAKSAFDDAYWRTGKRDADMKTLLSGRTV